jgi:hypothetical protein
MIKMAAKGRSAMRAHGRLMPMELLTDLGRWKVAEIEMANRELQEELEAH